MFLPESLAVLALALPLEATIGYPQGVHRRIGHPVTWIGRLIGRLDSGLNRESWRFSARRIAGLVALAICLAAVGAATAAFTAFVNAAPAIAAIPVTALVATSLIAQRSLAEHVAGVAEALRTGGLDEGRRAVSHIVGRNPETLDEAAVCRAAIESLAENFSDAVVAPAFWLGAGGLLGGALYKAINTADSMIGHRTPRHEAFGWAAARLDDLVNLPASRLSTLLIVGAAALQEDASAGCAWASARQDATRHRSPNAGWSEAAMAGALGLKLAGPRVYGATRIEDHWMGDGREAATVKDIERSLALYRKACVLLWMLTAVTALIAFALPFR